MSECPVCGGVSQQAQVACEVCGLPRALFEEFRDLADTPGGPKLAPDAQAPTGPAEVTRAAPSGPVPPGPEAENRLEVNREERSAATEKALDAESGEPAEATAGPPEEVLRVAHSLGMDVSALEEALTTARSNGTSAQVKRARRGLIRAVLDGLIERYRDLCSRRDVLSSVVSTQALDAELVAFRKALSGGELTLAEERRVSAQRAAESIQTSWNQIRTEVAEAGQMMQALREMGGVAPAVLRPVAEAIRIPRKGEAGVIERRLRKANSLLWGLLVPRMDYEISKGRTLLQEAKASAARTDLIRREFDRMAEEIRRQKVAEALESRRFLRAELASVAPKAPRTSVRRSFIE